MQTTQTLRTTISVFIIIFSVLTIFGFIMGVGGGGVLNDFDRVLEEMESLETQGLLENPPKNISPMTKREIEFLGNSKAVKEYIQETEANLDNLEKFLPVIISLLCASIIARIYFRKKS